MSFDRDEIMLSNNYPDTFVSPYHAYEKEYYNDLIKKIESIFYCINCHANAYSRKNTFGEVAFWEVSRKIWNSPLVNQMRRLGILSPIEGCLFFSKNNSTAHVHINEILAKAMNATEILKIFKDWNWHSVISKHSKTPFLQLEMATILACKDYHGRDEIENIFSDLTFFSEILIPHRKFTNTSHEKHQTNMVKLIWYIFQDNNMKRAKKDLAKLAFFQDMLKGRVRTSYENIHIGTDLMEFMSIKSKNKSDV